MTFAVKNLDEIPALHNEPGFHSKMKLDWIKKNRCNMIAAVFIIRFADYRIRVTFPLICLSINSPSLMAVKVKIQV
jgi:hypothetical protein